MSPAIKTIDKLQSLRPADPPCLGSSSDVDLLDAWRRDKYAPALAAIVERYSVMVLSVCRRRCRSESDAEDAYQTTFLYLARNGGKIRRPECLAGWLQRVAQRASIATLSSSKRETEPMVEPPTDPDDPLDRLTQRHEAIVLDEELAELPEHYRTAIVMHCYEDRPLQSLAEHFGTTVGSIRGRLQRGKQLLAQRLRRRGVVPVVAFAAAEAWQVSEAKGAQAAQQFIESTSAGGELPDPPIDTSLLESLLSQGVRLMPTLYTSLGLIGGAALIAAMLTSDGSDALHAQSDAGRQIVSLPAGTEVAEGAVIGQLNADSLMEVQPQAAAAGDESDSAGTSAAPMGGQGMGGGLGGTSGGFSAPNPFTQWIQKSVDPTPTSSIAQEVMARLDAEVELNVSTTLADLPQELGSAMEIPVLIDRRGIAFAKQSGEETVEFSGKQPLRTALRTILRPLGLKAIVEDEGLVITADRSVLVHQGIGVNRWINIDEDAERSISEKLEVDIKVDFVEIPVQDIVRQLRDVHKLPVVIDSQSLEDIGLSSEEPISFASETISLRNFLDLALRHLPCCC